jgi:hypothetical protein
VPDLLDYLTASVSQDIGDVTRGLLHHFGRMLILRTISCVIGLTRNDVPTYRISLAGGTPSGSESESLLCDPFSEPPYRQM